MSIYELSLTFFLVANPIGNSPAILALLKRYDFQRQKRIMLREALFSLLLALFFQFFGEYFLGMLKISEQALSLSGGSLLLLVALQMLFHKPDQMHPGEKPQEPFFVPIATPLIAGPGLMTMIMISSRTMANNILISAAILIAWTGVSLVLVGAPFLQKLIGPHGMSAVEQVMGVVLGMIAMQMIMNGLFSFVKTLA